MSVINDNALNMFLGEPIVYLVPNKIEEHESADHTYNNRHPSEYLSSLDPPGLPPFKLKLKAGCPIMLLRNISPKDGLYNGTRLMVVRCATHIIEAKILTGEHARNLVFIPRILLTPSTTKMPFEMMRRQFPVRLAFTMTINKSQG
ncbi:hypothetical protein GIB67_041011 [Kingdonia uniflora]|uniref:DNA helicase Pif1-like 2B domain-containing protein n=1 Tax=Kingdonia uniflora TaxID=39325 RepID=A0A7J7NBW8_9MAGN|nr:hypothetical protein GIB67_041011 [Kingdonia uniflora]